MLPHPVKQPNLARKFPLTDLPNGLVAAWSSGVRDVPLPRQLPTARARDTNPVQDGGQLGAVMTVSGCDDHGERSPFALTPHAQPVGYPLSMRLQHEGSTSGSIRQTGPGCHYP
jgi:hypothetical protein